MCQFQQFRFPSSDGSSSCYAGAWLPPEEPRGVVQIVHGVGAVSYTHLTLPTILRV